MHHYQVTVHTSKSSSTFIAIARNGAAAVSDALSLFPAARCVKAKPITTHILR